MYRELEGGERREVTVILHIGARKSPAVIVMLETDKDHRQYTITEQTAVSVT